MCLLYTETLTTSAGISSLPCSWQQPDVTGHPRKALKLCAPSPSAFACRWIKRMRKIKSCTSNTVTLGKQLTAGLSTSSHHQNYLVLSRVGLHHSALLDRSPYGCQMGHSSQRASLLRSEGRPEGKGQRLWHLGGRRHRASASDLLLTCWTWTGVQQRLQDGSTVIYLQLVVPNTNERLCSKGQASSLNRARREELLHHVCKVKPSHYLSAQAGLCGNLQLQNSAQFCLAINNFKELETATVVRYLYH